LAATGWADRGSAVVVAIQSFLLAQVRREFRFRQFALEAGIRQWFSADTFQAGTVVIVKSLSVLHLASYGYAQSVKSQKESPLCTKGFSKAVRDGN